MNQSSCNDLPSHPQHMKVTFASCPHRLMLWEIYFCRSVRYRMLTHIYLNWNFLRTSEIICIGHSNLLFHELSIHKLCPLFLRENIHPGGQLLWCTVCWGGVRLNHVESLGSLQENNGNIKLHHSNLAILFYFWKWLPYY